jgi:diguanylate cyclase (GGDEF)-like protein
MSITTLTFIISHLFFLSIFITTYLTKHLFIKYLLSIFGLIMFIISIKLSNIDFYTLTTFIFYLPMIYAFLLPDPLSTIIVGVILSFILSSFIGESTHTHAIIATIISIINVSISYTIIAYLFRKLKNTNSKLLYFNNELQNLNNHLKHLSLIDGLTGIFNRRYFDIELSREFSNASCCLKPLSLIMLDVDFFKAYNDTYGHQQGDKCLSLIAATLSNTIRRSGDIVARYGGEEFAVILPGTNAEGAKTVAENLRREVENLRISHINSKVSDFITISAGIYTMIPPPYSTPDEIISFADKALYKAKQEGKNRVKFYTDLNLK